MSKTIFAYIAAMAHLIDCGLVSLSLLSRRARHRAPRVNGKEERGQANPRSRRDTVMLFAYPGSAFRARGAQYTRRGDQETKNVVFGK
jgi:hypothetical protein